MGHFGVQKTQEAISLRFFWPQWKSDVVKFVSNCATCIARKGPHSRTKLPIKRYLASEPMQRIAIDILGPLPLTQRGNKYALVITDYFTKWPEVFPIPNQEAATVADILVNSVITRFGIPQELHSDQGRNFESHLIACLCERLGIHKTRTTPYRPQSDGQTERFNRTLTDSLAKICSKQEDWDMFVPLVCMYYRAMTHCSTGVSPALLMLGRQIRLPIDVVFPNSEIPVANNYPEYVQNLEHRLKIASEYARQHLRISWDSMSSNTPVSRVIKPLDLNKPVYLFNPALKKGVSPKLAKLWRGPYDILECLTPYLYRLRTGGRRGTQVVHRSHLFQPKNIGLSSYS
jgi:hypothetical protein